MITIPNKNSLSLTLFLYNTKPMKIITKFYSFCDFISSGILVFCSMQCLIYGNLFALTV
ncbi:hypothetical protein MtrunA17_Chr2g0302441 [Medicago truncatula]|uniref:Transmembrane protein n=1 Tax=Medicago truncatula TaxID=3880 RepID=A0A396J6W8_MEDTR|nr:hypothetical protein MtrunA17_Chr2g0302441 [Medicago truncatula]